MSEFQFKPEPLIDFTEAWKIAGNISRGVIKLYEVKEDLVRHIAQFDNWALRNLPWSDWSDSRAIHNFRRTAESVFFIKDSSCFLDLNKVDKDKFTGQVWWQMDQIPIQDVITISGREFRITTAGVQLLGAGSSVTPHTENPGVTEIIFPLWTLDHPTYGITPESWAGLASYQIEGSQSLEYLYGQMDINRLLQASFALRIKDGKYLQLDVYEPDYDAPRIEIKPIILASGKKHGAQSQTQCLYFALKLEPLSTGHE